MSEPEIVHPVLPEDAQGWLRQFLRTLLINPGPDLEAKLPRWTRSWEETARWGVRDGGDWVATLGTQRRVLTVPGIDSPTADLTVDALTAVTVAATHRRQGLLRRMITSSLRHAVDDGMPLTMLLAAEWSIYGRFGYAAAVDDVEWRFHSRRPGAALPPPEPGSMRSVEPAELARLAPQLWDRLRRTRAGQVDRPGAWWDRVLGQDGYTPGGEAANWFVHEGPDGPDGLLDWRVTRDFELVGTLGAVRVEHLAAANEQAYRDLWGYLAALDVIDEVTVLSRPIDEPIRWALPDARSLQLAERTDFLWVRLLDVPAALSARGYSLPGRVVLDVVDDAPGGYAAGRFLLDATGPRPDCEPTTEPADLRLDQRVLASVYLGGHRLRSRAALGGVQELRPGALALAEAMFATAEAPVCQTGF